MSDELVTTVRLRLRQQFAREDRRCRSSVEHQAVTIRNEACSVAGDGALGLCVFTHAALIGSFGIIGRQGDRAVHLHHLASQ